MMRWSLILLCLVPNAQDDAATTLRKMQERYYHPEDHGLQRLTARLESADLASRFPKLKECECRVEWASGMITVRLLDSSQKEVSHPSTLDAATPYAAMILTPMSKDNPDEFTLSLSKSELTMVPKSGTELARDVARMVVRLDDQHRVERQQTFYTDGSSATFEEFEHLEFRGKAYVTSYIQRDGGRKLKQEFEYKEIGGFLLPVSLKLDEGNRVVRIGFTGHKVEGAKAEPKTESVRFEPKKLATIPDGVQAGHIVFSRDGTTVAYVAVGKDRKVVRVNDTEGEEVGYEEDPVFAPVTGTLAYISTKGEKSLMVVGGKKGEEYSSIDSPPVFSSDGRHLAYSTGSDYKTRFVVVDGVPGPSYSYVGWPALNPEGSSVAYRASARDADFNTTNFVVVAGKAGPAFDKVRDPIWSPDGRTVAYVVNQGGKEDDDGYLVGGWRVMAGDQAGKEYEYIKDKSLVFQPDGKAIAFIAGKGEKEYVVVGDREGEPFDVVESLIFTPDSKTFAYLATPRLGGMKILVVGDRKNDSYRNVGSPTFSPKGKLAFVADLDSGRMAMILDDKPGPGFDVVGPAVWSPDGSRVAYRARRAQKCVVVVGDGAGEEFDEVWDPVFSADGTQVGHGARRGKELWWIVPGSKTAETKTETPREKPKEMPLEERRLVALPEDARAQSWEVSNTHTAWVSSKGGKEHAVIDGVAGEAFDEIWGRIRLAPDGHAWAYVGKSNYKYWVVTKDGKKGPYDYMDGCTLNRSGSILAYGAKTDDKWHLYAGDKKLGPFDGLKGVGFAPDGLTLVYMVNRGGSEDNMGFLKGGWHMVVGDKEGPDYYDVREPVFHPDGKSVVYGATKNGTHYFVVAGGKEGIYYFLVGTPVFNADGSSMAYLAWTSGTGRDKAIVLVNGKEGEGFEEVTTPVFSPDGKSVAYAASVGSDRFLVVGGKKSEYTAGEVRLIRFAPDGRLVLIVDREQSGRALMVGDKRIAEFDWIGAPSFSLDGKKIGFRAQKGREVWWKVLDLP